MIGRGREPALYHASSRRQDGALIYIRCGGCIIASWSAVADGFIPCAKSIRARYVGIGWLALPADQYAAAPELPVAPRAASDRDAAAPGMMMKDLPLAEVYQLLEPGPVVLLTTAHNGRANVMTMSWHMMVEFEPPLVGCVVSSANYSFAGLWATKECVIAVPARPLASKVVKVGNCSGRDVGKFAEVRPDAGAGRTVDGAAGRGVLRQSRMQGGRYAPWSANTTSSFLKCLRHGSIRDRSTAKTIHHHGYGQFVVDGKTIKLKSRMR